MTRSIYRSRAGERAILARYDAALAALPVAADSRFVEIGCGRTHILSAGPREAPPLLFLGGGNFLNPTTLSWFVPLLTRYRVHAPDVIGQPGLSAPTRPSPRGDGHARWLLEILDALGSARAPIVGISYGAGLAMRLAGVAPERIAALALIVPAGIVSGPLGALLTRIALPLLAYRLAPSPQRLARATAPLLSEENADLTAQIGASYRSVRLDSRLPRHAAAAELRRLAAPVLVAAGADDPFFPGAATLERARAIFPRAIETVLLPGSRHIPAAADFATLNARIIDFLERAR
jgi:pimeloyl-ACP methyl ester carboxylesterase